MGNGYSANLLPDESISGIQSPTLGFLTGVFESAPPAGDAPPSLDFNSIGTDFSSLSPILQQLFFIGDGLTGDGAPATFSSFMFRAERSRFIWVSPTPVMATARQAVMGTTSVTLL